MTARDQRRGDVPHLGTAVVTGGTSGIGLAIVRGLVARGFGVVATGRTAVSADLRDEFTDSVRFVEVDHADPAEANRLAALLDERFGPLTALINNVGRRHNELIAELDSENLLETLSLNVVSHMMLTKALVPHFSDAGGAIVNISSRLATVGMPGVSGYSASKGAINGFTVAAAIELAPKNIRVNALAPGMTRTSLIEAWLNEQQDPIAAETEVAGNVPLGRLAVPEDVASAAVFLASPEAAYLTGVILPADGGYTAA
ncbi:MAG: SDR family NAD(P)-dependent oxidoreductase [Leucobacter sp.]